MSTAAKSVATCCIVYTTDPTYLFPTLVSAMQARLFSSRQKADVAVFCLHLDPRNERCLRADLRARRHSLNPARKRRR